MDPEWEPEPELAPLIYQLISLNDTSSLFQIISVITQIRSLVNSTDQDSKPETELISLVKQTIYLATSTPVAEPEHDGLKSLMTLVTDLISYLDSTPDPKEEPVPEIMLLLSQMVYYLPWLDSGSEINSCIGRLFYLATPMREQRLFTDLDLAAKLKSLISFLLQQVIYFVMSKDLDSLLKPESKLVSLISQTASLFDSMYLGPHLQPLLEFVYLISQNSNKLSEWKLKYLFDEILSVKLEPEILSLIHEIYSFAISTDLKWHKLISLCPPRYARLHEGKILVTGLVRESKNKGRDCFPLLWDKFGLTGESPTHFRCKGCNGENHETFQKAPVEIKHPLHPKHSLQLVLLISVSGTRMKCYCCGDSLEDIFYCCPTCDYAMNIACVEKSPVLSIDLPKRHEHNLVHFPRQASLTCDICALPDSSCPFYVCLLCDFVVHQSCTSLPYVIRISRHPHRISFTPSFDQGSWSCGVCRREINNNYGGYSCVKAGCSYTAHSKCATQSNVWDGTELEGVPEEIEEEEDEPFVTISDGIIQHFSHEHHHLKLDEDVGRDYNENKQCHACVTPIYCGNYYSCMQCEFILHETCANLSRRMYHPIHSHPLTLMNGYNNLFIMSSDQEDDGACSACPSLCIFGFFYKCGKEGCRFKLHVQCAALHEPLVHPSHIHPLFLTSKPGEQRKCDVCKYTPHYFSETFNCIECADFALCFACATLPQKVSYKHDKHMLTLSYGKETSTMTYWCESCEKKINQKKRFYICDEYCCVTIHIKCLVGKELYMMSGASWLYYSGKVDVLPNNQHMSRPFCSNCEKRCPYNVVFQCCGLMFCSTICVYYYCEEHY